MEEDFQPLPLERIAAGIAVAALAEAIALVIVARLSASPAADMPESVLLMAMILGPISVALVFGLPFAFSRLRDPRLRHRDWAATGALAALVPAILFNLVIIAAGLLGQFGSGLGSFVVAVFVVFALAGATTGALARVIAITVHNRR